MRASDIVTALSREIPNYTASFSSSVGVTMATTVANTVTVTTDAPHNLIENQLIAIIGMLAPVQIDTASFLRTGSLATFSTLQDHDFTLSERDKAHGGKTLVISGANEAEFNGTFSLVTVHNRRKLTIAVTDAGPTLITGSPLVEDANGAIFNGYVNAFNVAASTFDYTIPVTYGLDPVFTNAQIQVSVRILSVLDINIYLRDVYTKTFLGDNQLVVQLGPVIQSKSIREPTDASSSAVGGYSYTPILIQNFDIYIIQNVTNSLTASEARDLVEIEYLPAILKSVMRRPFDTGFTYSQFRASFVSHEVYAFDTTISQGKAVYVHQVSFEQLAQLCADDMVGPDYNVAMRDIDYTLPTSLGTSSLDADIDLDQEPLP